MKRIPLPDIVLERYLLNELPEEKLREIETYIRENPDEAARLDELRESNRNILEEYTPEAQSGIILKAYEKEKRDKSLLIKLLFLKKEKTGRKSTTGLPGFLKIAVPAGALAIFVISFFFTGTEDTIWNRDIVNNNGEITRIKGKENSLSIYRKTGAEIKTLKEGDSVKNRDLLQIAYRVTTGRYAVILSIDGRSSVTLHFPEKPRSSARVNRGKTVYLKNSYELDNAPDFERFFLLVSDEKINIDRIIQQAEKLAGNRKRVKTGKLDPGDRIREISFMLNKED
jgi:hypothetical protein